MQCQQRRAEVERSRSENTMRTGSNTQTSNQIRIWSGAGQIECVLLICCHDKRRTHKNRKSVCERFICLFLDVGFVQTICELSVIKEREGDRALFVNECKKSEKKNNIEINNLNVPPRSADTVCGWRLRVHSTSKWIVINKEERVYAFFTFRNRWGRAGRDENCEDDECEPM